MSEHDPEVHAAPTAGSQAGAERIRPVAGTMEDRLLALIRAAGPEGHTNGELTALVAGRDVTVWPRVTSLRKRGKIKASGTIRPSPVSGTSMTVWVATTAEEEAAIVAEAERQRLEEAAIVEAPTPEALEAARDVIAAQASGGMFWGEGAVARIIQKHMAAYRRRLGKRAAKERANHA